MLFLLNLFLIARSNFSIKYKKAPYTADTYTRNKTITNPFTAVFIFLSSIRHYHKMIYLFPLPCFLSFILTFQIQFFFSLSATSIPAITLSAASDCYSALYMMAKIGVFRRINWRAKHTHSICRLTTFHVLHTWKSRPLAV